MLKVRQFCSESNLYIKKLISSLSTWINCFYRKGSAKRRQNKSPSPAPDGPRISIEEVDKEEGTEEEPVHLEITDTISEEGYQSDSDSSSDEDDEEYTSTRKLYVEGTKIVWCS